MTDKERLTAITAAISLVATLLYAGINIGRLQERIDRLTGQVGQLETEIKAVNGHFVQWTLLHAGKQ